MQKVREKWKKVAGQMKGKTPPKSAYSTPLSTRVVTFKTGSVNPMSPNTSIYPPPVAAPAVAITPSALRNKTGPTSSMSSPINYRAGNNSDSASEVGMVSIDLESPPMYQKNGAATTPPATKPKSSPSKNEHESASGRILLRIHDKDNDSNKIESRMAARSVSFMTPEKIESRLSARSVSFMTPDMMETVAFVEADESFKSRLEHEERAGGHGHNVVSPEPTRQSSTSTTTEMKASKKKKKRLRSRLASKKKKNDYRNNDTATCFYFADDDDTKVSLASTCSTSSSSSDTSKETWNTLSKETCDETCDYITQHPCPGREDWTYIADDESTSYEHFPSDRTAIDFDPQSFTGMVLTMPVACGLLLVDNILDTDFFDAAIGSIPNSSGSRGKGSISCHEKKRKKKRKRNGQADGPGAVGENSNLPSLPCLLL